MLKKKIMSLLLSASMIFSVFGAMISVDASEIEFTGITIDYNTMSEAPAYDKDDTATLSIATDTVMGKTKNVLKISTPVVETETNTQIAIPLGDGVSTKEGPFSITVLMKFPDKSTDTQANANCRVKGFPTLGADASKTITKDDNTFGIYEMPRNSYNLLSAGNLDLYVRRRADQKGEHNSNTMAADETMLGVSNMDAQSFISFADKANYVYYRWDIDPDDKTFKAWFSKDGKIWEKAYGDYNIGTTKNDGSRYSEKGLMPTGELPEVIKSLKFLEWRKTGDASKNPGAMDYYIASIDVQPLKSFIVPATPGLSYTMDYNDTSKYTVGQDLKTTKNYASYNGDVTIAADSYVNTAGPASWVNSGGKDFAAKNVLKWTPSANANLAIPLDTPIDTKNGKFTYTIGFKIPAKDRYPRHLGTLGGDMSAPEGELNPAVDAILGLSVFNGSQDPFVTAADRKDGYWGYKTSNNRSINESSSTCTADKTTNDHNIFVPEGEWHQNRYFIHRPEEVGGEYSAATGYSYGMTHIYHYMKIEVDPYNETFRYYHSDSRGWKEPYKNAYMMDADYNDGTISRYSESGIFPTGSLPEIVNSLKFRNCESTRWNKVKENADATKYETTYYSIASISVDQPAIAEFDFDEKPYFAAADKISMSFNNDLLEDAVDGYIKVLKNGTEIEGCTVDADKKTVTITLPEAAQKFGGEYTVEINGIESIRGDKFVDAKTLTYEYSWSLKDSEDYNTQSVSFSNVNSTGTVTNEGYVWTNPQEKNDMQMLVDIPDITLDKNPVEITFSAKFPYTDCNVDGFPLLVDDEEKDHTFGLQSVTVKVNGTKSYELQQTMARNMEFKFNALPTTASTFANPDVTNDRTKVTPHQKNVLIGSEGTLETALGASKDMYDFKFVIDPVSKSYRYYYKQTGANEWIELYKDYPSYPIAFFAEDDGLENKTLETMPSVIKKLKFKSSTQGNYETKFIFDNITVKELPAYTGVESTVTNRNYTFVPKENVSAEEKTNEVESATADVTVKIVNYGASDITDAKLFLAVYDAAGKLVTVKDATKTLKPGINTETFTGIDATKSARTAMDTKTYIHSDSNIYKLFVWDGTQNINPVALNVPKF